MGEMTYVDFDLLIEGSEAGYRARVLDSPAGQASAEFPLPFSDLELENFFLRIGQPRRLPRRDAGRREWSSQMETVKAFGGRLFEAVFGDEVRGCLRSSLYEANRQEAGLRVRLRLADAPELADLPWEYLYNPALNRFLALSIETPLVRYLDLPERIRPLEVTPPLRVLVMISSPGDYPQLDVDQEWAKLTDTLSGLEQRGLVVLEQLGEATLAALQRRLRRGEYHIFHFIGHGDFDGRTQDGMLLLEDKMRRGRPVSGQYLGTLLHNHRPLRLAILNACEGARTSRTDPFAGTAQSLVQQGIPAVIAMQFEITDEAAIAFAHEFYAAVADGYPVDAALAEARTAIFARGNEVEWGTPVLYMRAPDGRIFDVSTAAPPAKPPRKIRRPEEEEKRKRLAELYTQALSHFYTEQWGEAVEILSQIVSQQEDYEDAAGKLEEAKRQQRLAELYTEGRRAYEAQAWAEAIEHLEAILALDAGYRDAAALLEEARRQKALSDLYAEARRLHRAQEWQAVINVFERIEALDAGYPDPDGLLASAREELAEMERGRKLAALYSQGLRHVDAGEWPQALKQFEEIQQLKSGYRETEALLARVRQELPKSEAKPRLEKPVQPIAIPWRMVAGVLGVVVVILAVLAVRSFLVGGLPPPTAIAPAQPSPTSSAVESVVVAPMATSTPVPPTATLKATTTFAQPVATSVPATVTPKPPSPTPRSPTSTPARAPITPTPELKAGTVRVIGGAEMVYVPAGKFEMGSSDTDIDAVLRECSDCKREWFTNEQPRHAVHLGAFWIDRYEVTNAQYVQFLNAVGGHSDQCELNGCIYTQAESKRSHILLERGQYAVESGYEDHPVIYVTWYGAKAYCEWRGRNVPEQVRLPTEAEWEKAASWDPATGAKRIYPWGDEWDSSRANAGKHIGDTTEVGTYDAGKSPYGAYDMAGNVWEWVADRYDSDYYSRSPSSNPQGPGSGSSRVLRGGAWGNSLYPARAAGRYDLDPVVSDDHVGGRCAASPGSP